MEIDSVMKAKEIKFRVDDAVILALAAKLASQSMGSLTVDEEAALAALRRGHPSAGVTDEDLGQWLGRMDSQQLQGVVSNTKGVLHEMRFVELENDDGDSVYAAQFAATNHEGFDVTFSDGSSGAEWMAQLKATESTSYVNEWLEAHPGGQLLVTSEIAERMGLESSGVSNAELTADTEDLVDKLIASGESDTLWDYVPALSAVSVAMVVFELHGRLERGEIEPQQFNWMVAKAGGQRAARITAITVLLGIPGLNVMTAIGLLANALTTSGLLDRINKRLDNKMEAMKALSAYEHAIFIEKIWIEAAMESAKSDFDITERCKDDNFRHIYEETSVRIRAIAEKYSDQERRSEEYINPDELVPATCEDADVEERVRTKVNQLQGERRDRMEAARTLLRSKHLVSYFTTGVERHAGIAGGARLMSAIFS
jgi:hypothetical protein